MFKISTLIIMVLFFTNYWAVAQQTLVTSSGGVFITNNITMAWSLGEIATETLSSGSLVLTQGIQQPAKKITGIYENGNETLELSIYPNPVKEMLFLYTQKPMSGEFEIHITDAQGKLVGIKKINDLPAQVEMSQFENGLYLLNLVKSNQILITTYIVKN